MTPIPPPAPRSLPRRLLSLLLVPLAVAIMLVEEYLWAGLKALMAKLGRLPLVARLEARIQALPPWGAAVLFVLPGALMLPFKLAALWAMAQGQVLLGVGVLLAAKVTGTALFARLYTLCKPTLMTLRWFARLHDAVTWAKVWAHAKLNGWPLWRLTRRVIRGLLAKVRAVIAG